MNNGISTSSNETSYQVTGLYPFTVYSFRVLAVNAMGRSRASKESYYMVTLREGECDRSYLRSFKCGAVGGGMDFLLLQRTEASSSLSSQRVYSCVISGFRL